MMSPPIRRKRGGNQRRDPARRYRPVAEWPELHRRAWELALEPGDRLRAGGPASRWAARSVTKTQQGYGRFLTWLDQRGGLDPHALPGTGITPALIATYIDHLLALGNNASTARCRAQELGDALRVMAPAFDWSWFNELDVRLRDEIVPSARKRAQMQHADQLLGLGLDLMRRAEAAKNLTTLRRAELYRDGMSIALLAARPIRIGNFTALTIGGTLIDRAVGYQITLHKSDVKNRRPLEYEVPAALAPNLARYIDHYRPILLTCGRRYTPRPLDALWISREGSAMAEESLRNAIKRRTRSAFDVAVPPHRFRDAATTDIADRDPEHMLAAASVLGNHPITMMKHYNQSRGRAAHARYHAAIAELRGVKPRSSH